MAVRKSAPPAAARRPGERRYWLMKTEPEVFAFSDLMAAPGRTSGWDGVRNYVARNFLRDGMKRGDLVFIYHSNAAPQIIAGIAEVVREGYPDPTAFDRKHGHYDPKSDPAKPTWYQVDVRAIRALTRPVSLPEMRADTALAGMELLRLGNRLSVQTVREREWKRICALGGVEA